jgi:alpha-tubulin suppressor-like RCC1 family protein
MRSRSFSADLASSCTARRFVAVVSLTILATAGCREDPQSPTDPVEEAVAAAAVALSFAQVSSGNAHTCGVTSDNRGYCWGSNSQGQLGDGTTTDRRTPVPVSGTLRFRQISAGFFATCGVTTDSQAYCWGNNEIGVLGNGTTTPSLTPVRVAGGHLFRHVQVKFEHACALTTTGNHAYCWGSNSYGELGNGTSTFFATPTPVAVAGGHLFTQVTVGYHHSCGVTTDQVIFCWGYNKEGQLGDSSTAWLRFKPKRIAGTRHYLQVDGSREQTCAVTTDFRAFCWGQGSLGQLGTGKPGQSRYPRAVAGGLTFRRVVTGEFHTCAETTTSRAYCWGSNTISALGDGTTETRYAPVPVAGGLLFAQVHAGGFHTCARTSGNVAYCWGRGFEGQLGNGSTTTQSTPVAVAGTM